MGKAIPEQHPAVVLRSQYVHLRALLVAALIAVLGLTTAVVIVANDDDVAATDEYEHACDRGRRRAPRRGAPLPQRRLDGAGAARATTAGGGDDIAPSTNVPARPSQAQAFPGPLQAEQGEASTSRSCSMDLRRLRAGGGENPGQHRDDVASPSAPRSSCS